MGSLEAKLIGALPVERQEELQELLSGVSGLPAEDIELHELVLRPPLADRADLTLQHSTAVSAAAAPGPSGRPEGHAEDR